MSEGRDDEGAFGGWVDEPSRDDADWRRGDGELSILLTFGTFSV